MKFEVTKQWKKLPFNIFTTTFPSSTFFRVCASAQQPDSKGIQYTNCTKSFFSDNNLWLKLDSSSKYESVEIDVENFM
ncbi:MAG: hypothetical protein RR795_01660 [Cetobacterium sp.]|uniref:hypothetical protein n=1 Tax=Cetobacterium sp. TaxID=2071632 RepID=UPI002FCA0AAF